MKPLEEPLDHSLSEVLLEFQFSLEAPEPEVAAQQAQNLSQFDR